MTKKTGQLSLIKEKQYRGRKVARAFSSRHPLHLVFKAKTPVLRRHHLAVKHTLREAQLRYGVRIKEMAIMENHLHFLCRSSNRTLFQNFLRFFAGQLAIRLNQGKLWKQRAWSRVAKTRREALNLVCYILDNPVKAYGTPSARIDLHCFGKDGVLLL